MATKPCDVKILLANSEPSTNGTSETAVITTRGPLAAVIGTLSGHHQTAESDPERTPHCTSPSLFCCR
jgi:hypothetical protein